MRDQPEAIILGSSFSEIGFDPTNPVFTEHGHLKSMNFALAGAPWGMVQCDFEFAVSHAPIKRALVGFIPGNLPLVDCEKDFSSIGQVSTLQLLFSDQALQASIDTVLDQKNKKPSHTREGMYFLPAQHNYSADHGFREILLQRVKEYRRSDPNSQCLKEADVSGKPIDLSAGEKFDLGGLQRMIRTARKYGIELVLFAYPSHAYMLELEEQCEDRNAKWQAMKQISSMIDAQGEGTEQLRAYQFYAYNDITAEPVEGAHWEYWHDPGHFTSEMGNLLLADMFTGQAPKLGRILSPATIDTDYLNFLKGRTEYLKLHPEFQGDLKKLLPETPDNSKSQ